MIRSKYFGLAAVAFAMLSLGACTTDSDSSAPVISEFESANFDESNATWGVKQEIEFYGKATDDNNVSTLRLYVINSAGVAVDSFIKTVSGTSVSFGKNENVTFNITNPGTWGVSGSYTIRLTAVDNDGLSTSKDMVFKNVTGTNAVALTAGTPFTVGGFNTKSPSFISLGDGKAYGSSGLTTDRSNIDLIVTADDSGYGVFKSTALGVTNKDLVDDYWGTGKATKIAKVEFAPTTVEDAKAVNVTSQSAVIPSAGAAYVAVTAAGSYYVIKASSVSGAGDDITLTVTLLK